jgi:tetratricopeptide (TPR) repeat protein
LRSWTHYTLILVLQAAVWSSPGISAVGAEEWVEPPTQKQRTPRRPVDIFERAQKYLQEGQFEAAIKEYQIAIQADPGNVEALFRLAQVFQRLKRWPQAAATAERAYKLDNRHSEVQALWGRSLLRMGRFPESIWVLEGVVRLNAGAPLSPVYYDLSQAAYAMKWYDRSVDYALRHLQLTDTPHGHAMLARAYLAQGHKDRALLELQRSVQGYEAFEDSM